MKRPACNVLIINYPRDKQGATSSAFGLQRKALARRASVRLCRTASERAPTAALLRSQKRQAPPNAPGRAPIPQPCLNPFKAERLHILPTALPLDDLALAIAGRPPPLQSQRSTIRVIPTNKPVASPSASIGPGIKWQASCASA